MGPAALALIAARLEPTAVELSWTAPPGCPDAASIAEDLAQLTHGELVHAPTAAQQVRVVMTARGDDFELTLDITGGALTEHRTLAGASCETLARAATLMISVAIAPVASAMELAPIAPRLRPRASPPASVHAVTLLPDRSRSPTPARRAGPDRGFIAAWTGPSVGTQPRVAAIIGGDVGWRRGALGVQLSGWHTFASKRWLGDQIGVRLSTSGGGARIVYALPVRAVDLPLSLGVELGNASGSGIGQRVTPRPTSSLWVAAVLGVGLAWPARSRIALALRSDVLVTLRARGIHLERGDTHEIAFEAAPVGLRLLAGPLVRFP